mmetsp:Transcript_20453/g.60970  ORF Transcript_20453/g.60970 Transcript_20453/m.60970 type:complete len:212 (-) Transcript_20453:1024-1659(-)
MAPPAPAASTPVKLEPDTATTASIERIAPPCDASSTALAKSPPARARVNVAPETSSVPRTTAMAPPAPADVVPLKYESAMRTEALTARTAPPSPEDAHAVKRTPSAEKLAPAPTTTQDSSRGPPASRWAQPEGVGQRVGTLSPTGSSPDKTAIWVVALVSKTKRIRPSASACTPVTLVVSPRGSKADATSMVQSASSVSASCFHSSVPPAE